MRLRKGSIWAGFLSAGVLVAFGAFAGAASAVERVQDGGFDGATCDQAAEDCTSPVWSESKSVNEDAGPICQFGIGNCGYAPGSPPAPIFLSPSNWVQLHGPELSATTLFSSVEQGVSIPAAPATLRFNLLIKDAGLSTGTFHARIDGRSVFTATDSTPGYGSYAPVTVDVSAFAGGIRTLRFEATDQHDPALVYSDSFNVDDVSLDAADAPAPGPDPDPGPGPGPSPGPSPMCKGKVATVPGTNEAELLQGTADADVIAAADGNDIVRAGGGDDIVCGGRGKDELRGQGGNDKLFGDDGKDKLSAGPGPRDVCNGGMGNDTAVAGCERERDL